ncbi:MAG: ATP-binding protein [Pyrinomonadaceae bacterium]|nr:ATP-binding protein [Pyrinomonadaceae bacterium]
MYVPIRRKAAATVLVLGICLTALAVALNVGWILLNVRQIALLVFGIIFFALIITGLILNTIFLVREIRRNEQHDAFINSVTHELKTPIASIRLYLETLKMRDVTEAQRKHFYDVMLSDSDRLLQTVEQVLQAGRIKTKDREINIESIELNKFLRESVEIIRQRHRLDENAVRLIEQNENIKVSGDTQELSVVINNLLENAVKYSGEKVNISIETSRIDAKRVAVKIKDNGIGIANAELKRIFKRFHRAPQISSQKVKGTGLGLFIVQAIVKKHGGKITAESAGAGKGSTFTIQLPKA